MKPERIFSIAVNSIDKIYIRFRETDLTNKWNDDIIDLGNDIQIVLDWFEIMNYEGYFKGIF